MQIETVEQAMEALEFCFVDTGVWGSFEEAARDLHRASKVLAAEVGRLNAVVVEWEEVMEHRQEEWSAAIKDLCKERDDLFGQVISLTKGNGIWLGEEVLEEFGETENMILLDCMFLAGFLASARKGSSACEVLDSMIDKFKAVFETIRLPELKPEPEKGSDDD